MAKGTGKVSQALKALRSGLAKLKKAGLFSGDVRGAKGGWRQKKLVKTFSDVIAGKAQAVKVGKDAKLFDPSFRAKAGRVIVQAEKGERLRYSKRAAAIVSKRTNYGVSFKRIIPGKKIRGIEDVPKSARKGKKLFYKMPHNPMLDYDGMKEQFIKYSAKKGYADSLEIYELDADLFPDGDDDE